MPLPLSQSQACIEMADLFYDFLPGSGRTQWKGHVTFATVAHHAGVGHFWDGGSKRIAVTNLLQRTLTDERHRFEGLIQGIVSEGLKYRGKSNNPIRRDEIDRLISLLRCVNFSFPFLTEPAFLNILAPAENPGVPDRGQHSPVPHIEPSEPALRAIGLSSLRARLYDLFAADDRQAAGYAFEWFLNDLFMLFGLIPRPSFRLQGEQIDGSFVMDGETYLIEAKWQKDSASHQDLLVFHGKVEAKSAFTRGAMFVLMGVNPAVEQHYRSGRRPNLFIVDGSDLIPVVENVVALDELLRAKQRKLAEEGRIMVPTRELFP